MLVEMSKCPEESGHFDWHRLLCQVPSSARPRIEQMLGNVIVTVLGNMWMDVRMGGPWKNVYTGMGLLQARGYSVV